jgi:hypothetical protein
MWQVPMNARLMHRETLKGSWQHSGAETGHVQIIGRGGMLSICLTRFSPTL